MTPVGRTGDVQLSPGCAPARSATVGLHSDQEEHRERKDIPTSGSRWEPADAATWLASRPGRSGRVIWADGSGATVRDGASVLPSAV
jgi:hypothetical protein